MRRLGSVFSPVGRLGFSLACQAWGRPSGQSSWSPWVRSLPSRVLIGSLPMQVLSPRLVTPASGLATTEGCEEGTRSSSGSSTSRRSPAYAGPQSPGSSTTAREPKARGRLRLSSLWRVGGSTYCGRCCVTEPPSRPALRLDIFIEILLRRWVKKDHHVHLRLLVSDEHAFAKLVRRGTEAGLGVLMLRSLLCELLIGGDKLAGGERFASHGCQYDVHSVSFFAEPPHRYLG